MYTADRTPVSGSVVEGLSHVAIRTRDIMESIRYYTEVLGLKEAFRNEPG